MQAKITLIGAGNVGHHLALILHQSGHSIQQIFSRKYHKAYALAKKVGAKATNKLENVRDGADVYIIAVKDDAIQSVAERLLLTQGIVAHTSGSASILQLDSHQQFGSFYPLQTFRKKQMPDWSTLPFCIDGNSDVIKKRLFRLAKTVNKNVYYIDDAQRQTLHLSAVVVNNFTNHLLGISQEIVEDKNIPFDLLVPLLQETIRKAIIHHPFDIQTGPAVRNDTKTIQKHLSLLDNEVYKELYALFTKSISLSFK